MKIIIKDRHITVEDRPRRSLFEEISPVGSRYKALKEKKKKDSSSINFSTAARISFNQHDFIITAPSFLFFFNFFFYTI